MHAARVHVPSPMGARLRRWVIGMAVLLLGACATPPAHHDWESRLRGDAIVLLGEVHDNPEHHRRRVDVLRRAFAAGWRPALLMEQFDRERQADIERARRERPRDAQHVIDVAAQAGGGARGNWNWAQYRPMIALALDHDVPLIAANLSNADAGKLVRGGYGAVFDAAALKALALETAVPATLQAAQEREIDAGHCHALPAKMLPAMARAQLARDAVMASMVHLHAAQGAVLIAGNGHVRHDIGVPNWLSPALRARTWTVGYLEEGNTALPPGVFDSVVHTLPAPRTDPCIALRKRSLPP